MDTQRQINALREKVFEKQTVLGKIYAESGHKNIADYVKSWKAPTVSRENPLTQNIFSAIERLLNVTYGQETAKMVTEQLKNSPLVSTVDHHGILNHPFFVNANLFYSLKKTRILVCLPTSGVSLNNNTSWSACLLATKDKVNTQRFSFFPDRLKNLSVWSAPPLGRANIEKVRTAVLGSELPEEKISAILELLKAVSSDEILTMKNFSQQAQVISSRFWSLIFPAAPKLVYLPIEDLVARVVREAAKDKKSLLYRLLYMPESWELIEKHFHGSPGAFNGSDKGSFLFWGVDKSGNRLALKLAEGRLVGKNFSIELSAQGVGDAMVERILYPTSLVCFIVLLLGGLTCLGGFNQVNWLTGIKEKLVLLLDEIGEKAAASNITKAETENFAEGDLAFFPLGNSLAKPTGVDMYSLKDPSLYKKLQELGNRITLQESIDSLLPEIYRAITPVQDQDPKLLGLTDALIAHENGVEGKAREVFLDLSRKTV